MNETLANLTLAQLRSTLANPGLYLKTGPFTYRIQSSLPQIAEGVHTLYSDSRFHEQLDFVDFNIRIDAPNLLRRLIKPKLNFYIDHRTPFKPLPEEQAYAFLEWGMNWCVSTHMNQYLKLHAAVLEKNGRGLVMPGAPGAGKSTLCAALAARGWRLLSDEHALITLDTAELVPLCRPISLKNQSIDIIKQFAPETVLGPLSEDTHKGTVAHMKPSAESVAKDEDKVRPGWVLFPKYKEGAELSLTERLKETAFLKAADQSFNYSLLGAKGFQVMSDFIEQAQCFNLSYSKLEDAVKVLDEMAEQGGEAQV